MPALALVAALLALVATSPARADDWVSGGAALPTRIPDLPLTQAEVENHTRFHLTARWTPASAAHLWQVDLFLAARITPHLALTFGVPLAVLAPQGPFLPGQDGADRFALGNVRVGMAAGTRLRLIERAEAEAQGLALRLGGALDVYAPTSPVPDDSRLTSLAAVQQSRLDPGLWAPRALGFRGRVHAGLVGASWSVDGEFGLTPAFTVESDSDALLWFTATLRARLVLAELIEPFFELGGTTLVAEPSSVGGRLIDGTGLQLTPGVRFHLGGLSPAVFVAIYPERDDGVVTIGLDLAGAVSDRRRKSEDLLDRF